MTQAKWVIGHGKREVRQKQDEFKRMGGCHLLYSPHALLISRFLRSGEREHDGESVEGCIYAVSGPYQCLEDLCFLRLLILPVLFLSRCRDHEQCLTLCRY